MIKTVKLLVIIWSISYFLGILWSIYCEIERDLKYWNDLNINGYFYDAYDMDN